MIWLLVEDEESIREALEALLVHWGIEPMVFVNGRQAIRWLDEVDKGTYRGEIPVLALVDIRLPSGPDGTDISQKIRNTPKTADMGIALMTAYALSAEQERDILRKSQADILVYKPLPTMSELLKIANEVIRKRKKRR